MINKTELNKLRSQIDKNKVYIDSIKDLKIDDDKKHTMALSMSVLMEYFRVNQKMAYDSLTEGGGDNKIDALYYSDDSDEFTELVIIQSKFKQKDGDTDTLKEDEIKLCIKSCENILSGGVFQTTNKILEQKINNYRTLLKDNGLPPITIKLIFATNGIIHEGHKKLSEIIACRDKNISVSFVDATLFGAAPVFDNGELNVNLKDEKDRTDSIFSIEGGDYSGVVVSCSLEELMEFYKKTGERNLLSSNVRYIIKNSDINKEILLSFKEDPQKFCFLNNGITIICSEYQLKPTGHNLTKAILHKPSIVNGGQTIATLYQGYSNQYEELKDKFKIAKILIRIYKVPFDYSLTIAKATNLQNPINIVDLRSNDPNQYKAKMYLELSGIGLITKLGEDLSHYDDTITNEHILQVYASFYKDEPSKAKLSKAVIFKKYFDLVFSDSIDEKMCKKLLRCYQISDFLQRRDLADKSVMQNAFYSIIYTMKKVDPNITIEDILLKDIEPLFKNAFEQSLQIINDIIHAKQIELQAKFSMNNLFKGSEIKDLIDLKFEQK